MTKNYRSFSEIDQELKILRLKREIHLERLKVNMNRTKFDFSPTQLGTSVRTELQQMLISSAIEKARQWLRVLRYRFNL